MVERNYSHVPNFFIQDGPLADPEAIGAHPPRFGLLDDSPQRWSNFKSKLSKLNQEASAGTSYKFFFLGRHGQGWHNVAESKYGSEEWDNHWAKLDGDGDLIWGPDPDLTEKGKAQAREAHAAWIAEVNLVGGEGIPLPQRLYCSPMTRAIRTNIITFKGIIPEEKFKPTILENCREEYGKHTCDKRKSNTFIQENFPGFEIEDGFTEEDELWTEERETKRHVTSRAKAALDLIFEKDAEEFISITAHDGIINGFLRALGRPRYVLPTGGVIPVVIKASYDP